MDLSDLLVSTQMEEVASGFRFTEGPVWHPDGYLLFSDIPANIIYRLKNGEAPRPWRKPSGHSNGLALDGQGRAIDAFPAPSLTGPSRHWRHTIPRNV